MLSPCIHWAGKDVQWYDEDKVDALDTELRDNGIRFHHAMDSFVLGTGISVQPDDPIAKLLQQAIKYFVNELQTRSVAVQSEIAIAVNWSTGQVEVLNGVKSRDYPDIPGFQSGTADLVCVLKTGELLVADWKTGPQAEGSTEQLLSLACAFQRAMPTLSEEGQPIYRPVRISCLMVNEEDVWPNEKEVSQEQLDAHWFAMTMATESVDKAASSPTNPGLHCTQLYCPHLAYCPRFLNRVVTEGSKELSPMVTQGDLNYTDTPTSDYEAGFTMSVISACRRQMKYFEAKLKDYVSKGGQVISGDKIWSDGSNGWRWRKR